LDNYALYAVQALNMSEIDGSKLATYGAYIRPVACIIAGLVADRYDTARSILALFAISLVAYSMLSFATTDNVSLYVIYFNMVVTFFAAFAFRGIYYALLEETRTPRQITGASVAVIAFVGYTPEIFFGPVTGRILDANPGVVGHLNFFKFLFAVAAVGIVVTLALIRFNRQSIEHVQPA
jgi:nitrate/nitrite transporter NarK